MYIDRSRLIVAPGGGGGMFGMASVRFEYGCLRESDKGAGHWLASLSGCALSNTEALRVSEGGEAIKAPLEVESASA